MAYITINGKLVKTNKTFKTDPNLATVTELFKLASDKGANVKMNFTHLAPTQIIADTKTYYKATYQDAHGSYEFEIHKTDKGYTVISDGNVCSKNNPDREHIIWNYENQVAARMPKVLEVA